MKKIQIVAALVAVSTWVSSCDNHSTNPNFPVTADASADHHGDHHGNAHSTEKATGKFGQEVDTHGALSATDFLNTLQKADSLQAKVSAPINAVCQKKGCWMTLDVNGTEVLVTFKDYGFFVPKNATGHTAVLEGVARKEVVSVATLKHYAEDEGKTKEEIAAITQPETKYTFEAVGVIIR